MKAARRKVWISLATIVAASTLVGVAPVAATGGSGGPAVSVHLPRIVHEGQRGAILVDLGVRCRSGYIATELEYTIVQAEYGPATGLAPVDGIVCDGRWHTVRFSTFEAFDDGPATISVSLTVSDKATGLRVRTAEAERAVWVRGASDIRAARVAKILDDGSVAVRVTARCDEPWVASQVYVWIERQPEFGGFGVLGDDEFPCDGDWHTVTVIVTPSFGTFQPGKATVEATIDLRDAEHFDPVDQTMRISRIRLVAA